MFQVWSRSDDFDFAYLHAICNLISTTQLCLCSLSDDRQSRFNYLRTRFRHHVTSPLIVVPFFDIRRWRNIEMEEHGECAIFDFSHQPYSLAICSIVTRLLPQKLRVTSIRQPQTTVKRFLDSPRMPYIYTPHHHTPTPSISTSFTLMALADIHTSSGLVIVVLIVEHPAAAPDLQWLFPALSKCWESTEFLRTAGQCTLTLCETVSMMLGLSMEVLAAGRLHQ